MSAMSATRKGAAMPRTPKAEDAEKTEEATAEAPAVLLRKVTPPARRRETTETLPLELRQAIRDNITATDWLSNGEAYTGENADAAKKAATVVARTYRRDTARMLKIAENEIRTRVWENTDEYGDDDGTFSFGIRLKAEGAPSDEDDGGEDVPEGDPENPATDEKPEDGATA